MFVSISARKLVSRTYTATGLQRKKLQTCFRVRARIGLVEKGLGWLSVGREQEDTCESFMSRTQNLVAYS